jgi:hypothetical protein
MAPGAPCLLCTPGFSIGGMLQAVHGHLTIEIIEDFNGQVAVARAQPMRPARRLDPWQWRGEDDHRSP